MIKMMSGNCQDLVCYIHIHFHKNLEYVKPLGPYEIFTLGRKRKFYLESSLTLLWTCGTMRKSCFLHFFFPAFLVSTKWDLPSHQIQASEWTWHNHHPCVVKRLVGPGFPSHYTRVQFQSTSETGEVLGTTSSQLWGSFNKQLLHKGKGRRKEGRMPGYLQRVTEEFLFDTLHQMEGDLGPTLLTPNQATEGGPGRVIPLPDLTRIPPILGELGSTDKGDRMGALLRKKVQAGDMFCFSTGPEPSIFH